MIKLLLALHLWGATLLNRHLAWTSSRTGGHLDRAVDTLTVARREHRQREPRRTRRHTGRRRDERGSVTIEQVIWAGAVIVIVGIVVAAITAYVKSKSGEIK